MGSYGVAPCEAPRLLGFDLCAYDAERACLRPPTQGERPSMGQTLHLRTETRRTCTRQPVAIRMRRRLLFRASSPIWRLRVKERPMMLVVLRRKPLLLLPLLLLPRVQLAATPRRGQQRVPLPLRTEPRTLT